MKISLIIPSRNNLKYLEWAYNSIRKNQGDHEVEVCVADDASDDGTWNWCVATEKQDPQFKCIRNEGPERQGLVILNDQLINEVATHDLCMIYHADMYLCPGALDAIQKHMYTVTDLTPKNHPTGYEIVDGKKIEYGVKVEENEKTIVSLTRVEPPLHPDGPEKLLYDCGIEPEEFDEEKLLFFTNTINETPGGMPDNLVTEGIFAPWAFWKKDFQEIGGHDELFAPQSKEDSDIFNRFHLNGVKFVQTWEGFVYHMTSRGSRFNPSAGGAPGQNSPEWLHTTTVNMKNFIRKWGHMVQHDKYLKPIVPPKYDIGFVVENCDDKLIEAIEPWCSNIYLHEDGDNAIRTYYIIKERQNTSFNLSERVLPYDSEKQNDILVYINSKTFNQQDFNIIMKLPEIIQNSDGELGEFKIGNLKLDIINLNTYEKENIICKK